MLDVDTNKISSEIKNLDRYISNYSDNCYEIYNEISKLSSYWNDDNQKRLDEKIVKEKESNLLLLDNLEKISFFFKEVENIYDNK